MNGVGGYVILDLSNITCEGSTTSFTGTTKLNDTQINIIKNVLDKPIIVKCPYIKKCIQSKRNYNVLCACS